MLKKRTAAFIVAAFLLGLCLGHFDQVIASTLVWGKATPMVTTGVLAVKDYQGGPWPKGGYMTPCPTKPEGGLLPGTPVEVRHAGPLYVVRPPRFFVYGPPYPLDSPYLPLEAVSDEEYSKLTTNAAGCGR